MVSHLAKPKIFHLIFIFCFANVVGVLLAAGLPEAQNYFKVSKSQMQDVVSIYLLGCFLGQFIYAPLMKVLGKKTSLQLGVGVAVFGSLLCLFAIEIQSFTFLLCGRCITAIGSGCGAMLTTAIVTDYYNHRDSQRAFSLLMSGFSLIPAFGIAIGGVITTKISWIGCFYAMLGYCLLVFWFSTKIHEIVENRNLASFHPKRILLGFSRELSSPIFVIYCILAACGSCSMYIFATEVPFIGQKYLGIDPELFGLYNLIPNTALFVGGILSALHGHKIGANRTIGFCSFIFAFVAIVMGLLFAFDHINIWTVFLIPSSIFFLSPFLVANSRSVANQESSEKAYASACLYVLTYMCMFLSLASLHSFKSSNILSMPIVYFSIGLIMCFLWLLGRTMLRNKTQM